MRCLTSQHQQKQSNQLSLPQKLFALPCQASSSQASCLVCYRCGTAQSLLQPQLLYLSTGSGRAQMPRLLHWGYMVDQPTAENVAKYLGFIFGFKWLLIALALIFASWFQRRLFLAALSLLGVAFCFQFTIEVLANQKFLHIWVIIANLFVAFAF